MQEKQKFNLKKTIVLVGLMGCGKSAIGKLVAEKLNTEYFDSDKLIEELENRSISQIFEEDGEPYFRKREKEVIAGIIGKENCVIATGGGAFMDVDTRNYIKANSVSVWIRATLDILLERVSRKNTRPLLENGDKREILQNLIEKRYPVYQQADIVVDTTDGPHEIVVENIMSLLREKGII